MTKRALITGISGFTGRYMKASLEDAGYEVFGSSLNSDQNQNIEKVDLCDLDSIRKLVEKVIPDVVVHLGGVSNVVQVDIPNLYVTNIIGSRNLLQALDECKIPVQSIIMASSAHVYGNTSSDLFTEQTVPTPVNDYAISKLAMEKICVLWEDRLPIFIVRPFNYTGIGQSDSFLIPKIVNKYSRGINNITLGNIDVFREFNDVRKIVEIYTRLLGR